MTLATVQCLISWYQHYISMIFFLLYNFFLASLVFGAFQFTSFNQKVYFLISFLIVFFITHISIQCSHTLEKVPPYGQHFPNSCRGLQPSAATVGPFRPNSGALWAQPKKSVMKFFWNLFFFWSFFFKNFFWKFFVGSFFSWQFFFLVLMFYVFCILHCDFAF